MRVIVMEEGIDVPAKPLELPKYWNRRALAAHINKSIETLYKWEEETHASLKQLPHSFKIWRFRAIQTGRIKHPPLDDYQVKCMMLLAELRKLAAPNDTIAQTVTDNSLQFKELHELYAPKTAN